MKTILKSALLILSLIASTKQFAMQAPAVVPAIPLRNFHEVGDLEIEHERLAKELKDIKLRKIRPFNLIGLAGLALLCTKYIPRMLDRSIGDWKSRFLVPAACLTLFCSGWACGESLLYRFFINRLPNVLRLREQKHDFQHVIVNRVRQTPITNDGIYVELDGWTEDHSRSRFSLRLRHEIFLKRQAHIYAAQPAQAPQAAQQAQVAPAPVQVQAQAAAAQQAGAPQQ